MGKASKSKRTSPSPLRERYWAENRRQKHKEAKLARQEAKFAKRRAKREAEKEERQT